MLLHTETVVFISIYDMIKFIILYFQSKDPPCIEEHLKSKEEIQRLIALKNALINRKRLLDKQLQQLQSNSDSKVTS